jgi:hypothetical protein
MFWDRLTRKHMKTGEILDRNSALHQYLLDELLDGRATTKKIKPGDYCTVAEKQELVVRHPKKGLNPDWKARRTSFNLR